MSGPRVMVLCGRSPRHLHLANRLCACAEVCAVVHEAPTQWTREKLLRNLRPAVAGRKAWRWLRDRRRYSGNPEARFFFGEAAPALARPELAHEVPSVSDPALLALAERLSPELICVFGTSLIRGPLLERYPLINLHGGLSPEYRGADCTFWALHNGEPEQVGCTLHFIDQGIDTGRLIAHVSPEIRPDDDELTLFWRGVRDSAEVYCEALARWCAGTLSGTVQPGRGRLYQVRDRSWRAERALARRLARAPLPALPARVRWFEAAAPSEQ
ncbi:MAG: formyl transferase [Marichromatium sp.]|nr:formyl transferase [Marichromatium sp.]